MFAGAFDGPPTFFEGSRKERIDFIFVPTSWELLDHRVIEDDASLEIVVDVVDRRVAVPALDLDEPFELDDHTHHRLLNGLDDIGLTEQRGDEIAAYEKTRPSFKPSAPAA